MAKTNGHKISEETKKRISDSMKRVRPHLSESHKKKISAANKGQKLTKEQYEKYCQSRQGIVYSLERNKKISDSLKGRIFSKTHKRNLRISSIKRIEKEKNDGNQIYPRFNRNACSIIDEYGKQNGYNFQHAMNGGEFYIKELGYWVDGYDKNKNVVIEVDEKYHEKQKEKDISRQKEIESFLKCKFIRIKI